MATPRFSLFDSKDPFFKGMQATEIVLSEAPVPAKTRHLIRIRISQLNACNFCLNMHLAEARKDGETQERLDLLAIWRDAEGFSAAERAALEWAEALTYPSTKHSKLLTKLYTKLQLHYDTDAVRSLSYDVAMINAWNRVNIAAHNGMEH
ncbi:carboxymuconolactone decarboxylase family protein [Polycladidibacter hongkongensis]|uniref:carboxymuconolactone decarboxylase family protein n=1 Tax=Polycladidibacter hongkongensis TaxID=1647556 RepID=UPI000830A394|nr:carboxymuconolactone decarboxylase family protein [Pseudovibrio hongkongensis]